jgi:hypothetical protein
VDREGRVNLNLRANPRVETALMEYVESEEGIGKRTVPLNVGYITGPGIRSDGTGDFAMFRWILPADIDRRFPVTVVIRWVEHDTGSTSSYSIDGEIFSYKFNSSVVGATAAASKTFTGTVNGVEGFENGGEMTVLPGALVADVKALWLRMDWTDQSGVTPGPVTTDFLFSYVAVEYRTRFRHSHER